MAKILVLGHDGKPEKTKDGQDKFIYSVDGRHLVKIGKLMEVRKIQNINGVKKHVVTAYRPCTSADKKSQLDLKKAEMAKLQADINAAESSESDNAKSPAVDEKVPKTIKTDVTDGEEAFDSAVDGLADTDSGGSASQVSADAESESKSAEDTSKPKGRTRAPRQSK